MYSMYGNKTPIEDLDLYDEEEPQNKNMYTSIRQTSAHHQQTPEPHQDKKLQVIENYHSDCVDVSEHCQNCPVCKKLYSPDVTLYIIAIVMLVIICILLLKKILDKT